MTDRDHTDDADSATGTGDDDRREPRRSADSGGDPVVPETTQNLADLLAFLRADALDVYDAIDADERAQVDRWRRDYRTDVSADAAAETDTERLLKQVAVDQYRERCATDIIVRRDLLVDSGHADAVRDVIEEQVRLSSQRRARLRRLGVYAVDGGETGEA